MHRTIRSSGLAGLMGVAVAMGAVGGLPSALGAEGCAPGRALIILDKSSSMVTGSLGGATKWAVAAAAIDELLAAYDGAVELGLMMFPDPAQCSPGSLAVEPALGQRAAIVAALGAPPPDSGNWTPMFQTLDVAASLPSLADPAIRRSVILLTDGWQWCSPYDPATRFAVVGSVTHLAAMGISTFVVGFGSEIDALALNQMAVAGGTALAGCDATSDLPGSPSPCYFKASDPASLVEALGDIAATVSAEICDGLDNDCDGVIDNGCCAAGETRPCGIEEGACTPGTRTCGERGWGACEGARYRSHEICDGLDNDCDGAIDEVTDDALTLCENGFVCKEGRCVPEPDTPPTRPHAGEPVVPMQPVLPVQPTDVDKTGCTCEVGQRFARQTTAGWTLGLLFLVIVRRLRRR